MVNPVHRRLGRGDALAGIAAAACVWLAIWVAHKVAERDTLVFDRNVLEAIHQVTTPALVALAQFFSLLGPPLGLTVTTIAGTVVLWRARRRVTAIAFAAGAALTGLLNTAIKNFFERARPDLWPHPHVSGDSFPSGHAMQSAMVYGVLAILAARRWPAARTPILAGALLLILCIAASRAVLGVHWPTDLIAGLAIGTVCGVITLWTIDAREPGGAGANF